MLNCWRDEELKVQCSCGEIFDWEDWDGESIPVPKGIQDSIEHIRLHPDSKSLHRLMLLER